jgi:hypothetical protein
MYFQILIQGLAVIAMIIWTTSYHFKSRKTILLVQLSSVVFLCIHFFLLEAVIGLAISSIAAIRLVLFAYKQRYKWISHPAVPSFFIILTIIVTYLTATVYWAIFALIGGIMAIIASFQNEEDRVRKLFIPSHISWIIYDLSVGSYGGVLFEIVPCISAWISLSEKK